VIKFPNYAKEQEKPKEITKEVIKVPKAPKAVTKTTKEITEDVIDEVADEFANEVANLEAKNSPPKDKPIKKPIAQSTSSVDDSNASRKVSMYTNQGRDWQECPNRNWAAEFGYGGGRTSIGVTRDILSKMALSFKPEDEGEDKNDKNTRKEKSGKKYSRI